MWIPIKKALDRFLETLVAASMAILTIDVTWQVITRFILKNPSSWTEELATNLMIWVGLLGAAVALNYKDHLGIDYFTNKLPDRNRVQTELFVFTVISLFSLLVMVIGGISLVKQTLALEQISVALHIPMGYVYMAIPISGFFLVLYGMIGFLERLTQIQQGGIR